jgi:hypothetical protein
MMVARRERLVTEAGRRAVLLPGNIGESSVCEAVARKAIDAFGAIDNPCMQRCLPADLREFRGHPNKKFPETSISAWHNAI